MRKVNWCLRNVFTNEKIPIKSANFTIGRERKNSLVCKNLIISREHAKIYTLANDKLQIVNCSVTNSTYVNNEQVKRNDLQLQENDEIGFGVCMADYKEKKAKEPIYIFVLEKVDQSSSIIVIDDDESMVDGEKDKSIKEVTEVTCNECIAIINGNGNVNNKIGCLPETDNMRHQENIENEVISNGGNISSNENYLPGTSKTQQIPLSSEVTDNKKNHCIPGTSKTQNMPLSNVVTNIPEQNCVGKQISNCLPIVTTCKNAEDNANPDIKVKVELDSCVFVETTKNTNGTNKLPENNKLNINNQPVIDVNMEVEDLKAEVIEIVDDVDDDDDEYDFMCSQMYIKVEKCEMPDEQTKVGDDNFLQIKKEIAAMDDYDEQTFLPPIDIDSISIDNFDLQKELENSVGEESELQQENKPAENAEPEQSLSVQNVLTKIDQQSSSRKMELIEALPQPVKRRRSSAGTSAQDRKKVKLKEKKGKSAIASTSKIDTDKIKEARKDKLKQIEQNKKVEQEVLKPLPSRNRPSNVYVKVSKGRGNFLINDSVLSPKDVPIVHKDKQTCTNSLIEKYGDIIEHILDWNFTWFKQYSSGNFRELPQVTKKPLIKMCNTFSNFKNYYDVLQPLLMVDYWFNLSSEIQNNSYEDVNASDHFYATADVTKKKPHSEMLCTTYITSEQKNKMLYVREQNIITIATRLNRSSKEPTTIIGVVIWVRVDLIQAHENIDNKFIRNRNIRPKYKITFLVLVNIKEAINHKLSIFCRFFPSFKTFLRQVTAIKLLKNSPLQDYILYPKPEKYMMPSIQSRSLNYKMVNLNDEQKRAVLEASYFIMDKSAGVYMINGPPGTGKSTVITNIILEALLNPKFKDKVLLLAHSNCAIDTLLWKLIKIRSELAGVSKHKMKLLRIGNRASPNVQYYTLDHLTEYNMRISLFNECPQLKNDYEILNHEMKDLQKSCAAEPNDETSKQLMIKVNEMKNFCRKYLKYRFQSRYDAERNRVMNGASVICSTIGSCLKLNDANFTSTFNVCILDEATQCTEPDTLIPIYLGVKKMIMVGDTKQLPAITSSMYTKDYDYHVSLFSRIKYNISKNKQNPILTLKIQYRMNPEICRFPSKIFYDNALRNNPCYKNKFENLKPYIAFSQDLCNANLYYNTNEVDLVLKLIGAISEIGGITRQTTLGIITVYSKQKEVIKTALANRKFNPLISIQCSTVDGFQGQEMDIIIFSAVRNFPNRFSSDGQRINVSFTRAKHAFYIVACKNLFETCPLFKEVKSNAVSRKAYHKVHETTTTDLIDIIKST